MPSQKQVKWSQLRVGLTVIVASLTLGLLLSVAGLLVVLLLPARPGSKWRVDGRLPRLRRAH